MNEIDVQTLSQLISKRVRELGITQSTIAEAINADQSQVSRVLSGKSKRASRVFNAVCNYVNFIPPKTDVEKVSKNDQLLEAIASVWDGTDEHAMALSIVIKSLKALNTNSERGDSQ